ncbi:MAG TPA: hypothetical protein VM687_05720 [Stenotrophomonas sp.]|nr:hypothetical protein [Stenotrophomonas sp.]
MSARDYGVLADGVTNDLAGLQAAINYCAANEKELALPEGEIVLQSGLTIPSGGAIHIRGAEAGTQGTRLVIKANAPIITVAAGQQATIENVGFIGEMNAAKALQSGVYLNNCNNVNIRHCTLDSLYDSVVMLDTVFYSQIVDCRFFQVVRNQIRGTGTSGSGYAIRVSGCQVTSNVGTGTDVFYFENAGSLQFSDLMASPATSTGRCLRIVSNAAASGIHQFDNCVFEGSAQEVCRIEGNPGAPIKHVYFSNCDFIQSGAGGGRRYYPAQLRVYLVRQQHDLRNRSGRFHCRRLQGDSVREFRFSRLLHACSFQGARVSGDHAAKHRQPEPRGHHAVP